MRLNRRPSARLNSKYEWKVRCDPLIGINSLNYTQSLLGQFVNGRQPFPLRITEGSRNPSRIDAKRGDQDLQADKPGTKQLLRYRYLKI
jgi:hypothetical protein